MVRPYYEINVCFTKHKTVTKGFPKIISAKTYKKDVVFCLCSEFPRHIAGVRRPDNKPLKPSMNNYHEIKLLESITSQKNLFSGLEEIF